MIYSLPSRCCLLYVDKNCRWNKSRTQYNAKNVSMEITHGAVICKGAPGSDVVCNVTSWRAPWRLVTNERSVDAAKLPCGRGCRGRLIEVTSPQGRWEAANIQTTFLLRTTREARFLCKIFYPNWMEMDLRTNFSFFTLYCTFNIIHS